MAIDGGHEKNDEDKDLELDLMAEQELLRLTRQFRVTEVLKKVKVMMPKSPFLTQRSWRGTKRLTWKKLPRLCEGRGGSPRTCPRKKWNSIDC